MTNLIIHASRRLIEAAKADEKMENKREAAMRKVEKIASHYARKTERRQTRRRSRSPFDFGF